MSSLSLIVEVVQETVEEWDLDLDDELGEETLLSEELCFSSIEMMHLLAAIDLRLGRKLPYERLIKLDDDRFRSELSLGELAVFVDANLSSAPATVTKPA